MPWFACRGAITTSPINGRSISAPAGWFLVLILLATGSVPLRTQAQFLTTKPLVPLPKSRLWLQGETTVSTYTCRASLIRGFGFLKDTTAEDTESRLPPVAVVRVQVPVEKMDCGKPAMNRDMYQALKSKDHPYVHYRLQEVIELDANKPAVKDTNPGSGWMTIKTRGELTIAGSTRTVVMPVSGKKMKDTLIAVRGHKSLNMKSFGIVPPTALFGLVQVKDSLTVHFDVLTTFVDTVSRTELQRKLNMPSGQK